MTDSTIDDVEVSDLGVVARVRTVSDDGCRLTLEYRNGNFGSASRDTPIGFDRGDVVLVHDDRLDPAPAELWPDHTWIAVVRIKTADVTILDRNHQWVQVPTNTAVAYHVGNTVEADDSAGVLGVLSTQPINSIDLPELDGDVVDRFRPASEELSLTFDDFGGSPDVVGRARDLVSALTHHDRLQRMGARPLKGVLFTGLPGTGKTMLARIVASQSNATFFEISGPEILSKWVGQSEELLRLLFDAAAAEEKSIIFFDELDSVAVQRDDTRAASRQVVAQLLTLMDGFKAKTNVVVIAATNRPQDIDPALLRPGRFDWKIEFRAPSLEDRLSILEVSARTHTVGGDLPHSLIATLTEGWTGAELAAIWSEAALLAATDNREVILAEDFLGGLEAVTANRAVQARVTEFHNSQPESGA